MATKVKLSDCTVAITEVRVRNFRCLKEINIALSPMTVLIGENNSGKTSFIEAISAAIGAGQRQLQEDDVYQAPGEHSAPKSRSVVIDILIRPSAIDGTPLAKFPAASFWLKLWGMGVAQDDDDNDITALRTQMAWNAVRGEYVTERRFLTGWQLDPGKWQEAKANEKVSHVSSAQLEPIALHVLDAKRDIRDDLRQRGSAWHRLVSDLGLSEKDVEALEEMLSQANERVVEGSPVLKHVVGTLNELHKSVLCEKQSVSLQPVTRKVRDLSKGIDVLFSTTSGSPFPIDRHGMGTRSLASILIFRAFTAWKQQNAKEGIQPFVALEEPEAHLHPQAQRAVFHQIAAMVGQKIVSTHSPYVCGQADIFSYRHFRKVASETYVRTMPKIIETVPLSDEDVRKIERMVLNTRGEILFARAAILFEGDTEEQALPIFAEEYWGQHLHGTGASFLGVGGAGGYLPFLRLVKCFDIPWFLFSDGEDQAVSDVNSALGQVGEAEAAKNKRVVMLPKGMNLEAYLVTPEYQDTLIDLVIREKAKNDFHRKALEKEWAGQKNAIQLLLEEVNSRKTRYGKLIPQAYTKMEKEKLRFPGRIRDLLEAVSDELGMPKRKA